MAPNPTTQLAVSALTLYAGYLAVICPCKRMLSCHMKGYFGSLGLASFLVMVDNGVI